MLYPSQDTLLKLTLYDIEWSYQMINLDKKFFNWIELYFNSIKNPDVLCNKMFNTYIYFLH